MCVCSKSNKYISSTPLFFFTSDSPPRAVTDGKNTYTLLRVCVCVCVCVFVCGKYSLSLSLSLSSLLYFSSFYTRNTVRNQKKSLALARRRPGVMVPPPFPPPPPPPGLFFSFFPLPPPPPTVLPPAAGALLGADRPTAACIGCNRLLVGVEDNKDLRISPRAGLGGPVGQCRHHSISIHSPIIHPSFVHFQPFTHRA